ncbi:YsnF/AvaK domain-containing protein [Pontibacter kalidii]|uniref:YsnF/AvaK domain-containing protein n=1 Tax=Pontibacter kalidii TaxID=2592049 RepID=UPI00224C7C1B|nr:YsnF/AvaK domain-containing protein [Pontibacter kalidii]
MKKTNKSDKILKTEFEDHYQAAHHESEAGLAPEVSRRYEEETIPVVEEQVQIGKREVETAKVHISKKVHEELKDVDIPSMHEEVEVERVAMNKFVDEAPPPVRYEGDKMIISVLKEEVVLQKRLVLVEELHVTKKQVETHQTEKMPLRKEEVTIERVKAQPHNPRQA